MQKSEQLNAVKNVAHGFCNRIDTEDVSNPILMKQVHSADVLIVDESTVIPQQVDAMVTNVPHMCLTIKTADCAPVLFADDAGKIIGVAHAGWKGAFQGVMEKTVLEMVKMGAKVENIVAGIGPCIHLNSFEVKEEFKSLFPVTEEKFFINRDGKMYFDFVAYVVHRLKAIGITKIDVIDIDTVPDMDYFSYRREPENPGRQYSFIKLV